MVFFSSQLQNWEFIYSFIILHIKKIHNCSISFSVCNASKMYSVSRITKARSSVLINYCFGYFPFFSLLSPQLPLQVSLHIRKSEKMGFLHLSRYTHLAILWSVCLYALPEGTIKGVISEEPFKSCCTHKNSLLWLGCSRTRSDWDWQKSSPEWIFPLYLIRSPGKQGSDNHVRVTLCTACPLYLPR